MQEIVAMADADRARQLEERFWSELEKSPFVLLGFADAKDSQARPMTAQIDGRRIWFFGSRSDDLVGEVQAPRPVFAAFSAKDHDFFAAIHGRLVPETDPAVIDRLWDPATAAWYDKGRDDPEVALVRFDTDKADLWEANAGSLLKAAYHRLTGGDPGHELSEDQRTEVAL
jgi:general stress protein 26